MSELTQQIEKANAAFVEEHKDGGLAQVSKYPSRNVAILTCMDTRLLDFLEPAMGLKRGEAKIIKVAGNTAGRTFDSVIGSLMVAVYELHVTDIIVVGHEDCGMLHTTAASLCKKCLMPALTLTSSMMSNRGSWHGQILSATVRNRSGSQYATCSVIPIYPVESISMGLSSIPIQGLSGS